MLQAKPRRAISRPHSARSASGQHDTELRRTLILGNGIESRQEVLERHIFFAAQNRAVAAAVAAMEIASGRALPEKVVEFVHAGLIVPEQAE